ncbi:hypothetical protein [Streptomyces sp. HUAS TT20]|uniref:hypothetical protein n=1 Tax=Streptomyces sp. HUAS TT20 TaxID=3447509 RepID=UPI0021D86A4B|nr:hypothetical protein [Streptomyces sp. HUAS 15-9]UXY33087.1 hypothetical protein N8I87_43050 [Streptomyces sp. HUAS 15-9]
MTSYIRKQATIAAIINVVLNSLITWLGHRRTDFVPLAGDSGIVVDVFVTSILLSLLVSLFVSKGVRHDLDAGRLRATDEPPGAGRVLSRLPARWWALGPLLGLGVAVVAAVVLRLLGALGLFGLSPAGFVVFMAVYTGVLGYAVTRWVIIRQLADRRTSTSGTDG